MTTPVTELAIHNGMPIGIFPAGTHLFPANLEALRELADALQEDLRTEHSVALELVARAQADGADPANDPALVRPFPLPRLLAFLHRRRPAFDQAARERIAKNSVRYGQTRADDLRALNAPEVLIAHENAELARLATPDWSPSIVLTDLVPNIVAVASIVDLEFSSDARTIDGSGEAGTSFSVDADITDLVLLAAQCCTSPAAEAIEETDDLAWIALAADDEGMPSGAPNTIRVRGALYVERCERLEFAVLDGERALLAVSMPEMNDS